MNFEDQMSIEDLRREVREQWDQHRQFMHDLAELPDVPDYLTLRHLAHFGGGFPDMWEIGKAEQREHRGKVPYKTEYEIAQGLWSLIRNALRAHAATLAEEKEGAQQKGECA